MNKPECRLTHGRLVLCLVATAFVTFVTTVSAGWAWDLLSRLRTLRQNRAITGNCLHVYDRYAGPGANASATERGNAIAVCRLLNSQGYAPNAPYRVVAALVQEAQDPARWRLTVDRYPGEYRRTHLVLVFGNAEGRTCQILFPLPPEEYAPATLELFNARRVVMADVADMGCVYADKSVHFDGEEIVKRLAWHPLAVPIPDGDVAVGLRDADGTYSNFVPLDRVARP